MTKELNKLAESKDEKIRKVLIGWVTIEPSSSFEGGFTKEDILTWLKKQGKQKNVPKKELLKCFIGQRKNLGYSTSKSPQGIKNVVKF